MKPGISSEWDRGLARKGHFDGKFVLGLMTSGIYSLPSCRTRVRKTEEVRLFTTETAAKSAGLVACRICRPDRIHIFEDSNAQIFQDLADRVAAAPGNFANVSALARLADITVAQLTDLLRDHAHLTPAQWLQNVRVRDAAHDLLHGSLTPADVALQSGFASEAIFELQFSDRMRMTPGDYRALDAAHGFCLQLPRGYRAQEILAYHARDAESLSERSAGNCIWKALTTRDGPVVLELTLDAQQVLVRIHSTRKLGRATVAVLHDDTLRMLGLTVDVAGFERDHASFVQPRRGLRLPLLPRGFDALCWGIIGQQINIKFAAALRREIVALAGEKIGDMRAHPTPQAVADIALSALTSRRYSGSKARYLIDAAQAVATGKLNIENLTRGSAIAAEKALIAQRGIGVWTARYVLMRAGFADAAPVGDSGLATALQRIHRLPARPDANHTARLMSRYAPNRSLASMHLWTLLKEGP